MEKRLILPEGSWDDGVREQPGELVSVRKQEEEEELEVWWRLHCIIVGTGRVSKLWLILGHMHPSSRSYYPTSLSG